MLPLSLLFCHLCKIKSASLQFTTVNVKNLIQQKRAKMQKGTFFVQAHVAVNTILIWKVPFCLEISMFLKQIWSKTFIARCNLVWYMIGKFFSFFILKKLA
jgi:hypothetical protein